MTSPAPSGGSTPLRIGGIALVGVAVAAALGGLFTLATGGTSSSDQALAPTSSVAPVETPVEPTPVAPPPVEPPPTTVAPAPTTTASDVAIPPLTTEPSAATPVAKAPVEVLNNSRITGLADDAARDFRAAGWTVVSVGNYAVSNNSQNLPTSTVFYQPGQQAAAEELAQQFGLRARPATGGVGSGANLVVVVTKEYRS